MPHGQMPNLRRSPPAAAVNFAVDDEAAADAGADGDVEDRRQSLAGAEECLGEAGDVGVVAEHGGAADESRDPVAEREAVPAGDLVRLDDGARRIIDGPAE